MSTVGIIITSLGLICSIGNSMSAIRDKNSSATWGWVCCSLYMVSDLINRVQ